jgi:sigma-B regulation protein RsbU (phosphoserine phosphatase)
VNLGITNLIGFLLVFLIRPLLQGSFLQSVDEIEQPRRAFILDFTLCCCAGIIINLFNRTMYDIPLVNLTSMMIGCIIAGFFIGLDSSLAQEKRVILRTIDQDTLSPLPERLFPMTRKFTFVAITATVFVSIILIMVFTRDVVWLSQTAQDEQSIYAAQLSVTYEIFFIMAMLMVLIVNLIFSYSRNLKLLFNNQTRVLEQVSNGNLTEKVPVATHDEFGIIAGHTNHMIDGLRHRFELVSSLKLAEEVQQNLLPDRSPYLSGLDISGTSIYCDQTGGDYYDYFLLPGDKLGIVVADACGHGIGAAMLMTSVRAFLMSAVLSNYQSPASLLSDINNYITRDCSKTGRFTSMFFLEIDIPTRELRWVRAGHEPARVYHAATQTFSNLDGAGLVLGVDNSFIFEDSTASPLQTGDIIIVGTDGISETRNGRGEVFGNVLLETIIRNQAHISAKDLQDVIVKDVDAFRGDFAQEDDITLVVIKAV